MRRKDPLATIRMKPKRDRSLRHRHPWVFSGAVSAVDGGPPPGTIVDVVAADGAFLARGYYNEASSICFRALTWDPDETIDDAWWYRRVRNALDARHDILDGEDTTACRLVYAESDGLPGLVVDRYADVLVVQILTAGIDRVRGIIVDVLRESTGADVIFERSDAAARKREGLAAATGVLHGTQPKIVAIRENGMGFRVHVTHGQKTGFYLDQRDNRAAVARYAAGRRVLDAFSYTGAFSMYALRAGAAHCTLVDSSRPALEAAQTGLEKLNPGADRTELVQADVFEYLRAMRDDGHRYDLIVVDPPKFATSQRQRDAALRGYKDVNLLAMNLLEPGGMLATFSCSGAVDIAAFTMAVSWAGVDAGREVRIVQRLGQPADHPVLASFPESEYLKGVICCVG